MNVLGITTSRGINQYTWKETHTAVKTRQHRGV